MKRNKRRHKAGFGYIGSGNNTSVFNRKPRKVFSEIKDKLNFESKKTFQVNFNDKKLSVLERKTIKSKIKKHEKQKATIAFLFTLLLLISLFFVLKYIIKLSTHNF